MREVDAWKTASDVEFDYAMEGMEKLVMNRLYELCVSAVLDGHHGLDSPLPLAPSRRKSLVRCRLVQ